MSETTETRTALYGRLAAYKSSANAGLQVLRGDSVQGTWKLRVVDRAADDVGKLNTWSLRIHCNQGNSQQPTTTSKLYD